MIKLLRLVISLHTTSLSALALALGVSGPAALAVVTGLGAIYYFM